MKGVRWYEYSHQPHNLSFSFTKAKGVIMRDYDLQAERVAYFLTKELSFEAAMGLCLRDEVKTPGQLAQYFKPRSSYPTPIEFLALHVNEVLNLVPGNIDKVIPLRHDKTYPAFLLGHLALSGEAGIREIVANNPSTPHWALMVLAKDSIIDTCVALAYRNLDLSLALALAQNPHPRVKKALALNRTTPLEVMINLSFDASSDVREFVAERVDFNIDILSRLSQDPDESVRNAVLERLRALKLDIGGQDIGG